MGEAKVPKATTGKYIGAFLLANFTTNIIVMEGIVIERLGRFSSSGTEICGYDLR